MNAHGDARQVGDLRPMATRHSRAAARATAEALRGNSPLQGEVLKLMSESGLGAYYEQLVWNAQDGTANILTLLESAIAYAASTKAEALTDLGRLTWLADTDLSASLVALKSWHEGLSAENNAAAIGGVLAAKADEAALFALAQSTELSTLTPEVYGVMKRYAIGLEDAEWTVPAAADVAWLQSTAVQRSVIGSAQAQTWLLALGHQELPEIIMLPMLDRAPRPGNNPVGAWTRSDEISVTAYPNPANSGTVLDLRLPDTDGVVSLRVVDVSGRVMLSSTLSADQRLIELATENWTNGMYIAELWIAEVQAASLKLSVQH